MRACSASGRGLSPGIEGCVVGGAETGDLGLATDPEEARRAHALALGQAPQGNAAIPGAIGHSLGVRHGVARVARRIVKAIGDQAVVLGIKTGGDGVVIGKGERWIAGEHAIGRPNALLAQRQQMRGVVAHRVVPAETIERNQHHIMLALGPG